MRKLPILHTCGGNIPYVALYTHSDLANIPIFLVLPSIFES